MNESTLMIEIHKNLFSTLCRQMCSVFSKRIHSDKQNYFQLIRHIHSVQHLFYLLTNNACIWIKLLDDRTLDWLMIRFVRLPLCNSFLGHNIVLSVTICYSSILNYSGRIVTSDVQSITFGLLLFLLISKILFDQKKYD